MTALDFERFEIRAATLEHDVEVLELARHLNTVNLPNDRQAIAQLLQASEDSFAGRISEVSKREYVFLIFDRVESRPVGTSMIIGQLGRRDAPYIYFDVRHEEKYSATLDRHFIHTLLYTTYSYDGPTELGGLVVHPDYRGRSERLGRLISYVRFLFIAMRRKDFRDQLVAELLPPLEPDGVSQLWEAVGRRFTGLDYRHADRLSRRNKEFIRGLFPDAIYATLLSSEAQALIGQVGPLARGVAKMLARVGFRYAARVDPFDGGPHYVADSDSVSLITAAAAGRLEPNLDMGAHATAPLSLVARGYDARPYFVSLAAPCDRQADLLRVSPSTANRLGVGQSCSGWSTPLP